MTKSQKTSEDVLFYELFSLPSQKRKNPKTEKLRKLRTRRVHQTKTCFVCERISANDERRTGKRKKEGEKCRKNDEKGKEGEKKRDDRRKG